MYSEGEGNAHVSHARSAVRLFPGPGPLAVPARAHGPQVRASRKAKDRQGGDEGQGGGSKPVSFMRDVAPILVENCIACHNPRKSESKYVMTTFAQLAKGGSRARGSRSSRASPTRATWSS